MASKELSETVGKGSVHHHKAAKLVPFLRKVQQLCESAPPHIARWSADGKQFDVLDPKGFDELLKIHFEGAAPATFHRQLFFYGWVKLNHANGGGDEKTKGTWSFRHPQFLRDEPHKIYEIKRYARAADREELEDASRVDILERRVSALQSLVDDLSRKLAAVQLTLDRTPLAVEKPVSVPRKRVKDDEVEEPLDEFDYLNTRLSEDDIMHLFDEQDAFTPQTEMDVEAEPEMAKEVATPPASTLKVADSAPTASTKQKLSNQEEMQTQQAQEFLTTLIKTPQFHAAVQSKKIQEVKPSPTKVEALPHLSVC